MGGLSRDWGERWWLREERKGRRGRGRDGGLFLFNFFFVFCFFLLFRSQKQGVSSRETVPVPALGLGSWVHGPAHVRVLCLRWCGTVPAATFPLSPPPLPSPLLSSPLIFCPWSEIRQLQRRGGLGAEGFAWWCGAWRVCRPLNRSGRWTLRTFSGLSHGQVAGWQGVPKAAGLGFGRLHRCCREGRGATPPMVGTQRLTVWRDRGHVVVRLLMCLQPAGVRVQRPSRSLLRAACCVLLAGLSRVSLSSLSTEACSARCT